MPPTQGALSPFRGALPCGIVEPFMRAPHKTGGRATPDRAIHMQETQLE